MEHIASYAACVILAKGECLLASVKLERGYLLIGVREKGEAVGAERACAELHKGPERGSGVNVASRFGIKRESCALLRKLCHLALELCAARKGNSRVIFREVVVNLGKGRFGCCLEGAFRALEDKVIEVGFVAVLLCHTRDFKQSCRILVGIVADCSARSEELAVNVDKRGKLFLVILEAKPEAVLYRDSYSLERRRLAAVWSIVNSDEGAVCRLLDLQVKADYIVSCRVVLSNVDAKRRNRAVCYNLYVALEDDSPCPGASYVNRDKDA